MARLLEAFFELALQAIGLLMEPVWDSQEAGACGKRDRKTWPTSPGGEVDLS
jgi:hypothetical protein